MQGVESLIDFNSHFSRKSQFFVRDNLQLNLENFDTTSISYVFSKRISKNFVRNVLNKMMLSSQKFRSRCRDT